MSDISLSTFATAMSSVAMIASSTTSLWTIGEKAVSWIYSYAGELISAAEDRYADVVDAGATKFAAVMSALELVVTSLGQNWGAIKAELSAWVNLAIDAWSAAKAGIASLLPLTATEDAEAETATDEVAVVEADTDEADDTATVAATDESLMTA